MSSATASHATVALALLLLVGSSCGAKYSRKYVSTGPSALRRQHALASAARDDPNRHLLSLGSPAQANAWTDAYPDSAYEYYEAAYKDTCNVIARSVGVPKVALLFLTVGDLPHDEAWQRWMAEVVGKVPVHSLLPGCNMTGNISTPDPYTGVSQLSNSLLAGHLPSEAAVLCKALLHDVDAPIIFRQLLFNVYGHAPPHVATFTPGSLLFGRRINERVPSVRLSHTLVQVERFMLRKALSDELNQRFVFLSESQVPLYPAALVYQQFIHEPLARIDACPPTPEEEAQSDVMSYFRWKPELGAREDWRKTSHWISMTRPVADFVLHEREVDNKFREHCDNYCSNIEHYIPTMLATYKLDNLTSCARTTTYVDWSEQDKGGHPHTFYAAEVTTELFRKARSEKCGSDTWKARIAADSTLIDFDLLRRNYCGKVSEAMQTPFPALDVACTLFIRKVAADAADAVLVEIGRFNEQQGYASNAA